MVACPACGFEAQTTFKFCPECGAESVAEGLSYEQRKTVTVLFCDLTGSTALGERLDPERLRSVLAQYFDEMKSIVQRHGGSVEKFIGDAVMAVFGVPVLHEDDALRAVRAAAEMREALPTLGLQGRIGVMTGEVVTGTAQRLVTGDAVNVAARLEQTARPGEVLIGRPTLALARNAVDVEPVAPLALKVRPNRFRRIGCCASSLSPSGATTPRSSGVGVSSRSCPPHGHGCRTTRVASSSRSSATQASGKSPARRRAPELD